MAGRPGSVWYLSLPPSHDLFWKTAGASSDTASRNRSLGGKGLPQGRLQESGGTCPTEARSPLCYSLWIDCCEGKDDSPGAGTSPPTAGEPKNSGHSLGSLCTLRKQRSPSRTTPPPPKVQQGKSDQTLCQIHRERLLFPSASGKRCHISEDQGASCSL